MSLKLPLYCLKSIFILSCLLILQPAISQSKWAELDEILMQKQQLLGKDLVMMVASKDTILYKKELGDFKTKTQAPIASASKWLTAALIMILVDEGKISLDDKVVNYIPEFGKYFKNYITIRHCLSHMTGIKEEAGILRKLVQRRKYGSLEEEVNVIASREIEAAPGTEFRYNSYGLNIAGRIAEVVTKKKFDQLIKAKLFVPAGMRSTSFSDVNMGPVNPSGGAKSTAEDYMRFLTMLLNKGKWNGKQVITEESIRAMMEIQTRAEQIKFAPKSAEGFNYALGSWVVEEITKPELYLDGKPLNRPNIPMNDEAETRTAQFASALASPGLFGTWPMIDFKRGYAYLVFVKNLLGEDRANAHLEIKAVVDKQVSKTSGNKN